MWIDFRFRITGKTTTLLRVVSNHTTVLLLLHGCSGVQLSATCFQVGRPHALYRCTSSSSFSASVTARFVRHSCHVAALSFFWGGSCVPIGRHTHSYSELPVIADSSLRSCQTFRFRPAARLAVGFKLRLRHVGCRVCRAALTGTSPGDGV